MCSSSAQISNGDLPILESETVKVHPHKNNRVPAAASAAIISPQVRRHSGNLYGRWAD